MGHLMRKQQESAVHFGLVDLITIAEWMSGQTEGRHPIKTDSPEEKHSHGTVETSMPRDQQG